MGAHRGPVAPLIASSEASNKKNNMPLETATSIATLNASYPLGSDPVASADDHLRLIKSVLKAQFPNLTTPLTVTSADINGRGVPSGMIAMWSGAAAAIPAGWFLCDGQNNTPDMRDRFIVGAGNAYAVFAVGGALTATTSAAGTHSHTATPAGNHTHVGAAADHILTIDEIPAHQHEGMGESVANSPFGQGAEGNRLGTGAHDYDNHNYFTSSVGGGKAHTHAVTINEAGSHNHTIDTAPNHTHTVDTRSPYLALCYIMKA
jgi:hypothetical protein